MYVHIHIYIYIRIYYSDICIIHIMLMLHTALVLLSDFSVGNRKAWTKTGQHRQNVQQICLPTVSTLRLLVVRILEWAVCGEVRFAQMEEWSSAAESPADTGGGRHA